jgi:hypothetical protein
MQNFSYGDSAQYKSAVNTWTSWLLCDLVAGQLRAGGARPRPVHARLDPANKRADQGLRLSGVHHSARSASWGNPVFFNQST